MRNSRYLSILPIIFFAVSCNVQKSVTKVRGEREIEKGGTTEVSWNIENAREIHLLDVKEDLPASGKLTLKPDSNTIYKFMIIRGRKDTTYKKFPVYLYTPEIYSFRVPERVTDEEEFQISWHTRNALYTSIPGISDSLGPSGRLNLQLDTTTLLTLVAKGQFSDSAQQKKVRVSYVEAFEGTKAIYYGEKASMHWKFKNARHVDIPGLPGLFQPRDTVNLFPEKDNTYQLLIHRTNGQVDTLFHKIKVRMPSIDHFSVPDHVKKGELAYIAWKTSGVPYAILNGDTVPPEGNKMVPTEEARIHELSIYNGKETITYQREVELLDNRKFVQRVDPEYRYQKGTRVDIDIVAVDQSNYPDEVKLHVLVVDTMGNFVNRLAPPFKDQSQAQSFFGTLTEETVGKQYIKNYSIREIYEDTSQYDFSLVLDHSGSMAGIINTMQEAATSFINLKFPDDRVSVVKFDDQVKTTNQLSMINQYIIDSARFKGLEGFGGGTALYAGADEGIINLDRSEEKKVVVLFTDGFENSSFNYFGQRAFLPNQVGEKIRDKGINFIIISYGKQVNMDVLQELATLSGGKHYNILLAEDIVGVFNELPRVLRNYYEISFKPNKSQGKHTIKLSYNNQKGSFLTTETDLVVGEDWNINHFDTDTSRYWHEYIPPGKKLSIPPQTVANFDFDKDTLKVRYQPSIENFVNYLMEDSEKSIIITGHTDTKGTDEYCYDLADRRAKEIAGFMMDRGIEKERITTIGCGKDHLIWNPDLEPWQSYENRRVEVILVE